MTRFPLGSRVMFKNDIEEYGVVVKHYATACDVNVWNGDKGQYDCHHVPNYKLSRDD